MNATDFNQQIRDQFLFIAGTTGVFPAPHMTSPVVDSGGIVISASTPALTLPVQSGGVTKAITWGDNGAGITSILGNTVGGLATSNVLRFDIASGTTAGSATALTLDGSGRSTVGSGGLVVTAGGATVSSGNVAITTGSLTIGGGTPALTLPGQSGAVSKSVSWAEAGAGLTSILGTTVGGVAASNVLRFDIASGTSGGSVTALTLDGTGATIAAGPLSAGGGTVALSGAVRMANASSIAWRNNANSGDVVIGIDTSNRFVFSGGFANASTVGAAGGASAQPATPATYGTVVWNGTVYKIALHLP